MTELFVDPVSQLKEQDHQEEDHGSCCQEAGEHPEGGNAHDIQVKEPTQNGETSHKTQGHGSQDNANALHRAGIPCVYFAGSRLNGELKEFVADFGAAAKTVRKLQNMKIGIIGKLPGMGDVVTDDMAVYRKIGPEFVYDSIGTVTKFCADVTSDEVEARVAY